MDPICSGLNGDISTKDELHLNEYLPGLQEHDSRLESFSVQDLFFIFLFFSCLGHVLHDRIGSDSIALKPFSFYKI